MLLPFGLNLPVLVPKLCLRHLPVVVGAFGSSFPFSAFESTTASCPRSWFVARRMATLSLAPSMAAVPAAAAAAIRSAPTLQYIRYEHRLEQQYLPSIRALISRDLSEPYSIYVYRYFLYQWSHLCFMVVQCPSFPIKPGPPRALSCLCH